MDLTRRDFNRLTTAAFGGIVSGTIIGCGNGDDGGNASSDSASSDSVTSGDNSATDTTATDSTPAGDSPPATDSSGGETKLVGGELPEHNACLGLNQCKEYGKKGGEHECAGQGTCATAVHDCSGKNSCKYLGGCEGKVAANECSGKGGCAIPLTPGDEFWQQARAAFEKRMKAKGTEVGMAPLPGADGS